MNDDIPGKKFILQWHLTHKCNLRCGHCYQDDYLAEMSRAEADDALDKYLRFLDKNGCRGHVYLTGGEPLIHKDFFYIVERIRRQGIPVTVMTNGTLIDKKTAERFKWYDVAAVQVSLDGTREIHDAIRGAGAFERALRGIDALTAEDVPVIVSFTAQKNNIKCFPRLAGICRERGVKKLWWDRVVIDSAEDKDGISLSDKDFKKMVTVAARLLKKYKRPDGSSLVSCERSLQFSGCRDDCPIYTCHAGKDMIIITADGSVMPCRRLPFVIGNIKDGEIGDIFSSSELVKRLNGFYAPEECLGCKYVQRCRGGSKCVTYARTGELFSRDVNCFLKIKNQKENTV